MNWREPGSYFLPTLVAILIHVGAFALLIFEWRRDIQVMPEPLPPHMVANVIQEENKAVKDRDIKKKQQEAERLRQQRLAREKQAREKLAREKAAKEKLAKAKADKEKAVADKKAKEKAAAEKLAKEKAAKAKAEKEKAAKEKAAKVKAEKEKAAKEKAAKEKAAKEKAIAEEAAREAAEQSLMEQLALEEANSEIRRQEEAAAKAAQAERATQLTAEHQDIIRAQVAAAWRYPPNVTPEMEVEVRLTMVPTGEVISATVTKSSGHQALDRSVEQAIMKASPLSVPDDIRVFEKNFRTLTMKFRPENATW
jgi:colicin import membrane protein